MESDSFAKGKTRYYYEATVGTAHLTWYGGDDRQAKRKLARWLRLQWAKYVAKARPGTIGAAIDEGWHEPPHVMLGRTRLLAGDIIACERAAILESFDADTTGIAEFCRVYAGR